MKRSEERPGMLMSTIIVGVVAAILFVVGYYSGQNQHIAGLKIALDMFIKILPLLLLAFVMAGMIQVLLPRELLLRWIGAGSGMRGIFIGTIAGVCIPGGPYIILPIGAMLFKSGASIGTMVAFVTGWALIGIGKLPLELAIMGWRFTLIKTASVFFFPPIAGLIAQALFGR